MDDEELARYLVEAWRPTFDATTRMGAAQSRLLVEAKDAVVAEKWWASVLACGKLLESFVHPEDGTRRRGPLAHALRENMHVRSKAGYLRMHIVASDTLRRLRNSAAHFDLDVEVGPREALLAISACIVVSAQGGWIIPVELPKESLRLPPIGSRPRGMIKYLLALGDDEFEAFMRTEGEQCLLWAMQCQSLPSLRHFLERCQRSEAASALLPDAIERRFVSFLVAVGGGNPNLIPRIRDSMKGDRFATHRRVLNTFLPFDGNWLAQKVMDGAGLWRIANSVRLMKQTQHVRWEGLSGGPEKDRHLSELVWQRWELDGDVSAATIFVLARYTPRTLRYALTDTAPEEAVLEELQRNRSVAIAVRTALDWRSRRTDEASRRRIMDAIARAIDVAEIDRWPTVVHTLDATGLLRSRAGRNILTQMLRSPKVQPTRATVKFLFVALLAVPSLGDRVARRGAQLAGAGVDLWLRLAFAGLGVMRNYPVPDSVVRQVVRHRRDAVPDEGADLAELGLALLALSAVLGGDSPEARLLAARRTMAVTLGAGDLQKGNQLVGASDFEARVAAATNAR